MKLFFTVMKLFFSEIRDAIDLNSEMTSRTQILAAKQYNSQKSLQKLTPRSQVVRIIDGDDDLQNIAGQDLTYNSKTKKLYLEQTMSELGKPF